MEVGGAGGTFRTQSDCDVDFMVRSSGKWGCQGHLGPFCDWC